LKSWSKTSPCVGAVAPTPTPVSVCASRALLLPLTLARVPADPMASVYAIHPGKPEARGRACPRPQRAVHRAQDRQAIRVPQQACAWAGWGAVRLCCLTRRVLLLLLLLLLLLCAIAAVGSNARHH